MSGPTSDVDVLRVSATSHGINYLPEYFAEAHGLFAEAGVTVTATAQDPWTGVLDDLESGAADVALGGLWVPAMYAGARDYVAIGQLNARFSKVVLTRDDVGGIGWDWLSGKTVLVPGAGGTAPYEFTAGLIREAGVTLTGTRFVRDLSGEMLTDLWLAGLGDAYVTDLFSGTRLQDQGAGWIALDLARSGGVMPNSVYYVKPERLAELRDQLVAFMAAIARAMAAVSSGQARSEAHAVGAAHWPEVSSSVINRVVDELAENGTWSGIAIDPQASARWVRILDEAGLVIRSDAAEMIVDQSIAADALRLVATAGRA